MKVYLVVDRSRFEGDCVLAVFSTLDKATLHKEKLSKSTICVYSGLVIDEMKVDEEQND